MKPQSRAMLATAIVGALLACGKLSKDDIEHARAVAERELRAYPPKAGITDRWVEGVSNLIVHELSQAGLLPTRH
jgi:hypothetical protein